MEEHKEVIVLVKKSDLIDETWNILDKNIEKKKVEKVINTFLNILGSKLKNTNNVKLNGFGTFSIREKTINVNGSALNNNYIKFNPSSKIKPNKDQEHK